MHDEQRVARYRRWYRQLLRFYSEPYRAHFAEGMEQTFGDLCRERARTGQRLGGFVLWMFCETTAGIVRENVGTSAMQKSILRVAVIVGLVLLVPLFGNLFVEGWNWPPIAFVFWGGLLVGAGMAFELVAARGGHVLAYQAGVAIACLTGFVLVFINAAAGIIGDGPVNLLYLGVLAVGIGGARIAGFEARGMARALMATAVAQMLVPMVALGIWMAGWEALLVSPSSPHPPFDPGIGSVFALNALFAFVWAASALLFWQAGQRQVVATADGRG